MGATTAAVMGGGALLGGILDYRQAAEQRRGMDQAINQLRDVPSWAEFAPKSQMQQDLEQQSYQNYLAQQNLVNQMEAGIAGREPLQSQARGTMGGILGGEAFALTADEQARINAARDADVAYGSNIIQNFLDQRLNALQSDAARRGVRGQAYSQLQGGALDTASQSLENRLLAANQVAANQALQMPGMRAGIQAQAAGQYTDFADQGRQQAFMNRQYMQDPIMLRNLQNQRQMEAVQHGPAQGYGSAVMNRAMMPSNETAFMGGLMGGAQGGMGMGYMASRMFPATPATGG